MKGLIGRKVGMTHLYRPNGDRVAVTVLEAGPCVVTQCKTEATDGYAAVQLAFDAVLDEEASRHLAPEQRQRRIDKRVKRPQRGHFQKAGVAPHKVLREVRVEDPAAFSVGAVLNAGVFAVGEMVNITGVSKGKGFAGTMRRHNFSGQGASHGAKIHRKPASAGATDAARVFKGKRSPGHLGHEQVTTRNLEVVLVDAARNVIAVTGAVPGPSGAVVMIRAEE